MNDRILGQNVRAMQEVDSHSQAAKFLDLVSRQVEMVVAAMVMVAAMVRVREAENYLPLVLDWGGSIAAEALKGRHQNATFCA
jgi:hypothetical protein